MVLSYVASSMLMFAPIEQELFMFGEPETIVVQGINYHCRFKVGEITHQSAHTIGVEHRTGRLAYIRLGKKLYSSDEMIADYIKSMIRPAFNPGRLK